MGNRFSSKNGQSSERSVFPLGLNSRHVPKHLKPLRRPRKSKKSDSTSPPPTTNTTANPIEKPPQDVRLSGLFDKNIDWERPNHDSNSNENGPTGERSSSRYRWLGGRRFHGDKGFAYPLPIDQYELDRLRVQYYIFRWVFEGLVLAPVKDQLRQGCKVLNVNCGPGLWIGHPIIDMAMDYRQSDFTTIDICNLMSPDPYNGDEDFSPQSSFVFEPHANDTSLATDHSTSRSQPPQTLSNHSPLSNRPISLLNPGPLANEPGSSFGTNTPVVIPMTTPQHILSIPPLIELPNDDSFCADPELPRATQSCPSMLTHSTVDTKSGLISDISPQTSSFTQRKARVSALNSSLNSKRIFDNLEFCPIDVLAQTLPFEDNTFDYVQQSLVTLVYTEEDWDRMMGELVRVTKPGGYIQLTEVDYYTQAAAQKHQVWQENAIDMVLKTQNVNTRAAMLLSDMLTEAGLAEVETKFVTIPKGSWGLDIGLLWEENWLAFTCSVAPYLLEMTGTTWEDLEELQYIPPEEVAKLKSFNNAYCCWGRKPMA